MFTEWSELHPIVLQLEEEGLVTRTFRRLDAERQGCILDAILDEAAEHGPAALNIKRVAQRAGVSVGSLYQYFKDRDTMLDFAIEITVRYVTAAFEQYRPYLAVLPLRQALGAYLTGGIEWSRTQTAFLRLFARAAYQGEPALVERLVKPIANVLREMVAEMLREAQKRGEIRADVDLQATTRLIHALMIAAGDSQLLPYLNAYFQVIDPALPSERMLEALLDLILNGVAPGDNTERR